MVTGLFIADKGGSPQTFGPSLPARASPCLASQAPSGNGRPPRARSSFILPSPATLRKKKELWHWRRTPPCGVKKRQPQPGLGWPEPPRALRRRKVLPRLPYLRPFADCVLLPACLSPKERQYFFARQAITAFSRVAFSQLSTALPSKRDSVRKFMYRV